MFLGNEINSYWVQNATDYANWINVYNRAYDAIKEANPDTMIGTIFNYESLSGLGRLNGWVKSQWPALTSLDFSRVDVLGLTSYPFLNFKTASEMPLDFYQPVREAFLLSFLLPFEKLKLTLCSCMTLFLAARTL